ncbi:hypothetical protein LTR94_033830, partial [Friedmanniomyces endolithicus]
MGKLALKRAGDDAGGVGSRGDAAEAREITASSRLGDHLLHAKTHGGQFAAQQARRRAMLVGRAVGIDHDQLAILLERGTEVPEEG